MPRPIRVEFPGGWYHVMNRGAARQDVFLEPGDGHRFLDLLAETCSLFGVECHAYCLMPNHYHLLLHTPRGNLSRAMRQLNGVYTQRFNRRHGRDGPLFRGRYKAIVVDADNYLLQVSRYIHRNPVESGLVQRPEDYRWSSYRSYLSPAAAPRWLCRDMIPDMIGGPEPVGAYRDYVMSGVDEETDAFYRRGRQAPVRGDRNFVDRLRARRDDPKVVPPSVDTVVEAVARSYDVPADNLVRLSRRQDGVPRALAMALCRRMGGYRLTELGEFFGCGDAAVSKAISRVQQRMREDAVLASRVAELESDLSAAASPEPPGSNLDLTLLSGEQVKKPSRFLQG